MCTPGNLYSTFLQLTEREGGKYTRTRRVHPSPRAREKVCTHARARAFIVSWWEGAEVVRGFDDCF